MYNRALSASARRRTASRRRQFAWATSIIMVTSTLQVFYSPAEAAPRDNAPAVVDYNKTAPARPAPAVRARKASQVAKSAAPAPSSAWPAAARAQLPATGEATVGGLGVTVRTDPRPARKAATTAGASPLRIETLDRAASTKAGVAGPIVRVGASTGQTELGLSYRAFASAYGGDFGARLRLVRLPECALTTPGDTSCAPVDVQASNNTETQVLTTEVAAGTQPMLLAMAADEASAQGNYGATSLAPSAKWEVAPSSGAYTWNYPVNVPPVPGGQVPDIQLSYNSQAIDGRTTTTNNQGSWVGEGFGYEPGYIERQYNSCSDDGHASSPDLCWAHDNATIMLNGKAGTLVRTGSTWRFANDDGSTIKRAVNAVNDDNDGEHWIVTTPNGTQYTFGVNHLPGWSTGKAVTNSTWTVPVFGDDKVNADDDKVEPCYKDTFSTAWCQQAWRWNLDYVKDLHGNVTSYFYEKEENAYARAGKYDVNGTPYTRGGVLKRIDYGQRHNEVYTTNAPARVVFDTKERCKPVTGVIACNPGDLNDNTAQHWQDTPTDRICKVDTKCKSHQLSPSFFTRQRLTGITTQIRTSTTWVPVDGWVLDHDFLNNGDGSRSLWLKTITRSGWGGTTTAPITLPSVTLEPLQLPNRIDIDGDNVSALIRPRLGTVYTESGAQIDVTYEDADCGQKTLPTAGNSDRRCYPVKWSPTGEPDPVTDWFHKYVVREVIETDRTGGAPDQVTRYDYLGDAAWRHSDASGLSKDEDKYLTWSQWRGYAKVRVTEGDGQTMTTKAEHTYLRGLDGDKKPSGGTRSVTREDSTGTTYTDKDEFAAFEIETAVWAGSKLLSKTLTRPWLHQTASLTHKWGTDKSVIVLPEQTRGLALKADGSWRETRSVNRYDTTTGRIEQIENFGDTSTDADDQCTNTYYADNATLGVYSLVSRKETVAVDCSATVNRKTQLLADERTFYDGAATFGATPTEGNATRSEKLASHNGTTATYVPVSESTFDKYGRPLVVKDGVGTATTITYTQVNGLTTKKLEMGPLGGVGVTTEYLPAWAHATVQVDFNSKRTDLKYDKLGRLVEVLMPNRPQSTKAAVKYTYSFVADKPVSVKTEKLKNDGTYRSEYQIYDGFLRPRQIQAEGPDNGRLVSEVFYTPTGKVSLTNDTHFAAGAPSAEILPVLPGDTNASTQLVYDGADRVTHTISLAAGFEKWRTSTTYNGTDKVTVVPPKGGTTTTTFTDARGQTTERWQYLGREATGEAAKTRYKYTADSKLASVTDPADNVWEHFYDQRGREIRAVDPDAGETTTTYDQLDRPTSTTDARDIKLTNEYDIVGRRIAVWEGEKTTGKLLSSWTYDSIAKGELYSAARFVNGNKFEVRYPTLDALYRPLETQYVIPKAEVGDAIGGTYRFGTTYNTDGTVQGTSLPAAGTMTSEAIAYTYDDLQRMTAVEGKAKYVTGMEYSQIGELLRTTLDAGGRNAWAKASYERGTGRLLNSVVSRQAIQVPGGPPDTTPVSDVNQSYEYDESGNVRWIADEPGTGQRDIQCFQYDYLRRMTEAWTSASAAADPCAGGADATGVGGVAPYHQSYRLDAVGNRLNVTNHAVGGGTQSSRDYDYDRVASSPAHAVDAVTEKTSAGDRLHTYEYDESGNTTKRTRVGVDQDLTWDAEGNLASVAEAGKTTSFIYNADGGRLVRKEPGTTTLYLEGMEVRLNTSTSNVDVTRFYPAGGGAMVVRSTTGLQFQFADRHGTGQLSVDVATGTATHRRSDPFGNDRGTPPTANQWIGEKGFVGGNKDTTTGLTQLGARLYEPENGRFISVDPLIDTSDPQQMNAYSYSNNSPITYSDPAGTIPMATDNPADEAKYWSNPDNGKLTKGSGGKWTVVGSTSKPTTSTPSTPVESPEVKAARARAEKAKQQLINAGKALGKILMDELGVTDALDCVTKGDIGACAETVLNIAGSFVGGMITKIARKYGWPSKWAKGKALGEKLWALGNEIVGGIKTWLKETKLAKSLMSSGGCPHSFRAGTLVLMADGTTKRIEDIAVGEKVTATDPESGDSTPREVEATHENQDEEFTDVLVTDEHGDKSVLNTTANHPFWSTVDRKWVEAGQLDPGDTLRASDRRRVRVSALVSYTAQRTMFDLTVKDVHTYHVVAGIVPVLVHNCDLHDLARAGSANSTTNNTAGAVARDTYTGETAYGESGSIPSAIHPQLKKRLDKLNEEHGGSVEEWPAGQCAEFNACNNLLFKVPGARLDEIEYATIVRETGQNFPSCGNCRIVLGGGGAKEAMS